MSSEPAIVAHRLSKVYKLGLTGKSDSFATILKQRVRHPIRGGGRRREEYVALDDVSFALDPGEVVGVIGRNGAGKSTLLKILSRITYPTSGHVDVIGRVGSLLEVGTGFHQELTGMENVYLNGTILGMSRQEIDARLDAIVAFAEIDKFLDTPVKRYSSGMRVRLAFAVAAHLEPEVLMIDEVLSVGDAGFQAKCLDKMREIASEDGRTVIFVSHNLVSVEHLCPRSLFLLDGRLDFDGDTVVAVERHLRSFPSAERSGQRGVFSLGDIDRSGTGYDPVFQAVRIRPSGGDPDETVRMGEPLQIEIDADHIDAATGTVVVVTVGSAMSQCHFRMTSQMKPLEAASTRTDRETVVLTIPWVPLTPGDYHVDLMVKGSDTRGVVDLIPRAARFTVVPADLLGSGFHFTQHDGQFVVPFDWEIRPTSSVVTKV